MTVARSARWWILGVVVLVVVALSAVFFVRAAQQAEEARKPTQATVQDRALALPAVLGEPHIVFRSTAPGPTYGLLAAVPLSKPSGPRAVSTRPCDRLYATAGAGVCLAADRGVVTTYSAELLGPGLQDRRPISTTGIPSRARISYDGTWVATTSFVSGHGYTDINFSTQTSILRVADGKGFRNLETQFTTYIDGERITARDLNVWGVTFPRTPDPNLFYATVSTGGSTWLARGDVRARTMTAIQQNAECPSLSPDGTKVVYKKRTSSRITWRYAVLDLATMTETELSETRSVDDQAEWLDDGHVLYGIPHAGAAASSDVWVDAVAPAGGAPRLLIPNAWSPAVVAGAG